MKQEWYEARPSPLLTERGRTLKAMALNALGVQIQKCDYCASTVILGEKNCSSCGAAVTHKKPEKHEKKPLNKPPLIAFVLCLFFPPAFFILIVVMFWRWLRHGNTGWVLPLIICVLFPPAAFMVAPALFLARMDSAKAA